MSKRVRRQFFSDEVHGTLNHGTRVDLRALIQLSMFSVLVSVVGILAFSTQVLASHSHVLSDNLSTSLSPNGFYAVQTVDRKIVGQGYPQHQLFFTERRGRKKVPLKLYSTGTNSYQRSVSVLWSPASDLFVVNDWWGSNRADSYLYRVSDLQHPTNIGKRLREIIKDENVLQKMNSGFHTYILVTKWLSKSRLEILVAGDYPISGQVADATKKPIALAEFTSFYEWNTLHSSIKRTKQVMGFDIPPGL
jgi:hypothetical protein